MNCFCFSRFFKVTYYIVHSDKVDVDAAGHTVQGSLHAGPVCCHTIGIAAAAGIALRLLLGRWTRKNQL